jgi:septal ring factor EnvC (AmiA/AmiB activator)
MSTAPETFEQKVVADWAWLKVHFVLLALVAGLIFAGVYGVESIVARHDDANAKRLDAVAAQLAQSNTQTQQQTQQQISQLAQQNAALQQQQDARDAAAAKQIATLTQLVVQVKTTPQVVTALPEVLTAPLPVVPVAQPDGSLLLPQPDVLPLFQQLAQGKQDAISVTKLTADLAGATTAIANDKSALADSAKALDSEKTSHAADTKAAAADLTACKADARKGKFTWFGIGYVAGFLTRVLTFK